MVHAPDALKWLAKEAVAKIPSCRLGGIAVTGSYGYHMARDELPSSDYSVQTSWDRQGNADAASAIDLTMNDEQMKKVTARLIKAAEDPDDTSMEIVREFFGTTNGNSVNGRRHNSPTGSWSFASSDDSHLWHVHISIFRKYSNDKARMEKLLATLLGGPPPKPKPLVSRALDTFPGVRFGPVGKKLALLVSYYPSANKLIITSARRSGNDYHSEDLYSGGSKVAALDISYNNDLGSWSSAGGRDAMRDFAEWCEDSGIIGYRNIIELIHTTPYDTDDGYYVKNGQKLGGYGYGPATNSQHENHVHLAMTEKAIDAALKRAKAAASKEWEDMTPEEAFNAIVKRDLIKAPDGYGPENTHWTMESMLRSTQYYARKASKLESKVDELEKKLDAVLALLKK